MSWPLTLQTPRPEHVVWGRRWVLEGRTPQQRAVRSERGAQCMCLSRDLTHLGVSSLSQRAMDLVATHSDCANIVEKTLRND